MIPFVQVTWASKNVGVFLVAQMAKGCTDVCLYLSPCHKTEAGNVRHAGQLQLLPIPDAPWVSVGIKFIAHLSSTLRGHSPVIAS